MDMQLSKDGTHFITASTDMTAKLVDTESLEVMKTYDFGRPCNSAAISPLYDHVSHPRHVKVVYSPQSIKMELSQLALIGNKPLRQHRVFQGGFKLGRPWNRHPKMSGL